MKEMQKQPTMMTIREIAGTGLMSEHALRIMLKAGKLPAIFIGKKHLSIMISCVRNCRH